MLAKSRKSSFNENIGKFCSIIIIVPFFYGTLDYLDIFRIQAYAIKFVKRVHGVQKMFFRLSTLV